MADKASVEAEKTRLGVISLGCPKNLVDTEVLLGKAAVKDYVVCADPADAEVVIVNTCGFIDEARAESMSAIREAAGWKRDGRVRSVVVAGCMAQRYGDEIQAAVPEVDSVIGMSAYEQFDELLDELTRARREAEEAAAPWRTLVQSPEYAVAEQTGRLRVTPAYSAYLKISEGCSNACTFCAIPNFRGLFRSKPRQAVLAEARELVASGARELNIISQDTTHYGVDLAGERWQTSLASLLEELAAIGPLRWMRLLYAYPGHVSDELIAAVADNPKVVPYLDMPIQHINSRMLKRMGRRHTREETCELLEKLRSRVPDIALRTTFIVGFPGETEAEFQELLDFIEEFRFERLGVFAYSHEEGTPAGERFADDIPAELKAERVARAMELQQGIAFAWAKRLIGRQIETVIEGAAADEDGAVIPGLYVGRTLYDAPMVDAGILIEAPEGTAPGTFAEVAVTGADGYDLRGRLAASAV